MTDTQQKSNEVSAEEIKSIAENYFLEHETNWLPGTQKADTTFGFRIGYKAALQHQSTTSEPIKDEELSNKFKEAIFDEFCNLLIGNLVNKCFFIAKQYAASKTKDLQKDLDLAMAEINKLQMNQLTQ